MWLEKEDEENSSENSEGFLKKGQVGTCPKQASPGGAAIPATKKMRGAPDHLVCPLGSQRTAR